MAFSSVADEQLELAQASYSRCQRTPEFFRAFYQEFLASDPAIAPMFANTRFEKQDKLLQHGISLLLIYAKRPNPSLIQRLVDRHGPADLNIPARLYPLFVESFLKTVKQFDPVCNEATLAAWKAALAPGVTRLSGGKA